MPFKSENQRRYMHANLPEIAQRWEQEYSNGGIMRLPFRGGGAYQGVGGYGRTKAPSAPKSNPNMGGGGGRDSGAGPIGPVAPPTTFIGGKQFNVTPFNRDERERADLKAQLMKGPVSGNFNRVDPITGQSKKSSGIGGFFKALLPTLLGFATGIPGLGLLGGGFQRVKDFNNMLQNSTFGQAKSHAELMAMLKAGGADAYNKRRIENMAQARGITKRLRSQPMDLRDYAMAGEQVPNLNNLESLINSTNLNDFDGYDLGLNEVPGYEGIMGIDVNLGYPSKKGIDVGYPSNDLIATASAPGNNFLYNTGNPYKDNLYDSEGNYDPYGIKGEETEVKEIATG